ncbi:integral membrane protein [Phlyctema vagabunda]|uniref:Integral membrane protein n=1 Tax=Phlyctema vagabunda TaxID=108571 RepID=A0ABR4PFG5_9HELO
MLSERQTAALGPPTPVSLESNGSTILAYTGFVTAVSCVVVLARLYVRAVMLKTMGTDDYIMVFALLCTIFCFVSFIAQVHLGIGEHIGNPHLTSNFVEIMHWSYFHAIVIVVGISSVKISVGFFLLRLVQTPNYKRFILAWIGFLVIFTLACAGTLIFQCVPVYAAWEFMARTTAKCYSVPTYKSIALFNGITNIVTDFVFATLPIPLIIGLQMNRKVKISLICVLSLSYFACAAAIVKTVLLSGFFEDPDYSFHNSYQVWNDIEFNTGILAACLPSLRPLFSFLSDTVSSIAQRSGLRSHTNPAHHYYQQQEDDVKLEYLRSSGAAAKQKTDYGVTVSVMGGGGSAGAGNSSETDIEGNNNNRRMPWGKGPKSRLEQSIGDDDDDSESQVHILPPVRRAHHRSIGGALDGDETGGITKTTMVRIS